MKTHIIFVTILAVISSSAFADDDKKKGVYSRIYTSLMKIEQNASAIDDLDSRVQTNTNSIQSLEEQVKNLPTGGGGTGGTDPQVQANTTAINNLDTQVQTNTSAIATNSSSIQNNTTNQNSLANQVSSVQAELGTVNTQVQTNTSDIVSNTSRIVALENSGITPPEVIDFSLYVTTMITKQFQMTNGGACNIVRQDISRTDTATGTNIDIVETLTNGIQNCTIYNYGYVKTATSFDLVSYSNTTLGSNAIFDRPGTVLNSGMGIGKSFGFAITNTTNQIQSVIQKNTLLAIESVTVPFGTYDNCLKIHSQLTSNIMANVEQVSWVCQGVGEVKRIFMDRGINIMRMYNLTSAS